MNPKARQDLKAKAHKLKPIILIGNKGLTEAVNKEIHRALDDHELIKIRLQSEDRQARKELAELICSTHHAELVQVIGNIGIIYRKNEDNDSR